jgi:Flp pilus assembly protein TadG
MKPLLKGSFLRNLARNVVGSTIAIYAIALFPLVGLIGGGVDMSRLYITKTRLQQACDAGALSGRKAMGSGAWSTTTGGSRDKANLLFDSNFTSGDFGTTGGTRSFTESGGVVTGTASATVPMTLMRVFGQADRTVSVSCSAKMEIPNTDVMFVLDLTASMNCAATDSSCGWRATEATNSRTAGLRKAVKCFYEALLKANTSEVCTANDPSATTYTGTAQIRLGFVPYAVNVNVGRLLPNNYVADNWNYQSRIPNTTVIHTWVPTPGGTITPPADNTYGGWTNSASYDSLGEQDFYNTWTVVSGSNTSTTTLSTGGSFVKKDTSANATSTNCRLVNTWGSINELVGFMYTDGTTNNPTYSQGAAPNWPANTQAMNASRDRTETDTFGYRYRWQTVGVSPNQVTGCFLEYGQALPGKTFTQTQTSSAGSRPITWTDYERLDSWTYKQMSLDVSGLKAGGAIWNTSASVAGLKPSSSPAIYDRGLVSSTVSGLYVSGSTSSSSLLVPAPMNVTWQGCIEELPTHRSDNDYDPIPTDAKDLVINHIPTVADDATKWKPLLEQVHWGRYTGTLAQQLTTRTLADVTPTTNVTPANTGDLDQNLSETIPNSGGIIATGVYCPTPARKLTSYSSATVVPSGLSSSFEDYIDGLVSDGVGTHHDIGLLWGARLLSPSGIFSSENALTSTGGQIERNLIFMTDGDSKANYNNLTAYGSPWYDRRQSPPGPCRTATSRPR